MNKIITFGIILMIALIACEPTQEKTTDIPVLEETDDTTTETTTETTPEPVQTPTEEPKKEVGVTPPKRALPSEREDTTVKETTVEPKTETDPQIKALLKRAEEKLTSMSYLYGGTETSNLFLDTYLIKGDKVKIKKFPTDQYVMEGHYDTIYVNQAIACCEERSRCLSHNIDNTKTKFTIDTETLKLPKTPYQWVKEVPTNAQVLGPQTVDERSATYLKYTKDGVEHQMWIDDTYGVPHKVIVKDANGAEIKYQFNDLKFNGVKDTEFDAPCD